LHRRDGALPAPFTLTQRHRTAKRTRSSRNDYPAAFRHASPKMVFRLATIAPYLLTGSKWGLGVSWVAPSSVARSSALFPRLQGLERIKRAGSQDWTPGSVVESEANDQALQGTSKTHASYSDSAVRPARKRSSLQICAFSLTLQNAKAGRRERLLPSSLAISGPNSITKTAPPSSAETHIGLEA